MREALDGKLVISILAGLTIASLRAMVPESTRVVRAMPNTPCKVSLLVQISLSKSDLYLERTRSGKA